MISGQDKSISKPDCSRSAAAEVRSPKWLIETEFHSRSQLRLSSIILSFYSGTSKKLRLSSITVSTLHFYSGTFKSSITVSTLNFCSGTLNLKSSITVSFSAFTQALSNMQQMLSRGRSFATSVNQPAWLQWAQKEKKVELHMTWVADGTDIRKFRKKSDKSSSTCGEVDRRACIEVVCGHFGHFGQKIVWKERYGDHWWGMT